VHRGSAEVRMGQVREMMPPTQPYDLTCYAVGLALMWLSLVLRRAAERMKQEERTWEGK
jgi:hypothetical protein